MPRAISHPTNRQSSASSGNSLRILPPTGRHALPGTASTRAIRPDRQPIVIDDSSESEPSSDDEAPPPASKASTSLAPPARPAKPISLDRNTRSRKSTASSSSATTTTTSSSSSGLKRTRSPVVDLTAEESPEHAAHASPRASHHSSQSKGKSKAFEPVPGANSNKRMRTTASPTLPDFEDDLTCAICYEIFMGPVNLSCGHVFCASCLTEWLEKTKDCPTCREPTAAEPGRALVIESIAEKFYQGQAARLENKGDPAGATAMRDQRAKRSQVIEAARIAKAKIENQQRAIQAARNAAENARQAEQRRVQGLLFQHRNDNALLRQQMQQIYAEQRLRQARNMGAHAEGFFHL